MFLSCQLFLVLDKVVLWPQPPFFPKGTPSFHSNEGIVFPSPCPAPKHKEYASFWSWLSASIWKPRPQFTRQSILVLVEGNQVYHSIIGKCTRQPISRTYNLGVCSSRAADITWAFQPQAPASKICKATNLVFCSHGLPGSTRWMFSAPQGTSNCYIFLYFFFFFCLPTPVAWVCPMVFK